MIRLSQKSTGLKNLQILYRFPVGAGNENQNPVRPWIFQGGNTYTFYHLNAEVSPREK